MPTCSAVGCNNRSGECTDKTLSFHKYPFHDKTLLKEWIGRTDRGVIEPEPDKKSRLKKPWEPTRKSVLCLQHFTTDCFTEDLYHKYGIRSPGKKQLRKLKDSAVPTLFPHKKTEKPTLTHREEAEEKSPVVMSQ
jgi:hypothetical protein